MMRQLSKIHKDSKGFTLVELMIVVAIIGILAAIAIPNFRNYQMKAKRGELPMNLKAIKVAEVSFQAENDTFLVLTASPVAIAALSAAKQTWADNGNFAVVGWQPTGPVYGSYAGAATTAIATDVSLTADSDIDGDGTTANYTAVADTTAPANETEPTLTTGSDIF
jgi:type IV pilus assembly protein PilA